MMRMAITKAKDCVCDSGREWCCSGITQQIGRLPGRAPMLRYGLGHTAYHHVGMGDYQPSPSSPYYLFGIQHRMPYNWAGGAGGVPWSGRAAETRELSGSLAADDLLESGLEPGQYTHFPAFNRTMLHDPRYFPTGDWPLIRPAGPEPMGLSDNEKKLGMALALGAIGWMIWKKMGRRSNPARGRRRRNAIPFRYQVVASTKGKRRKKRARATGTLGFTSKGAAEEYADYLRVGGHKARVRRKARK